MKILGKIPHEVWIAFSGGVDSVVAADFCLRGKRKVNLIFVNHGTECSRISQGFVEEFAKERKCNLEIFQITKERPKTESLEEFWRKQRYDAFGKFPAVITAHHLNDAVETWLWRSFNGIPRTIRYKTGNAFRPFLLNKKETIYTWARMHGLSWVEDASNTDIRFTRNRIRHVILPEVLKVNPGIFKVVRKRIMADFQDPYGSD